jgi:hypothetical protein
LLSRALARLRTLALGLTGYREDRADLGRDAQAFWNDLSTPVRRQDAHWRGHGVFADDALWLSVGRGHGDLLERAFAQVGERPRAARVVEWGCGGGANAVHFGRDASVFYGVDVSPESLTECERQMTAAGLSCFVPVPVDANQPRAALSRIEAPVDLFLCLYVMELLPTEAHALEVMDIAAEILRPGGWALVHIRRAKPGRGSRPWSYAENMAMNVRFTVDAFARACRERGLDVRHVESRDEVPELNERDYVYFVLQRRHA